ncbi:MAG: formyltransferase family protein [Thermoguttaceae bacterium]
MIELNHSVVDSSDEVNAQWLAFRSAPDGTEPLVLRTIDELRAIGEGTWPRIACAFKQDSRAFDTLLLRLHYRRRAVHDERDLNNIRRFLTIGYLNTNDVRYFNEFLWFDSELGSRYANANTHHFFKCLDSAGRHVFPLASPEEVRAWISRHSALDSPACACGSPLRVATLGPPVLFRQFCREIANDVDLVTQIHFPGTMRGLMKLGLGRSRVARLITRFSALTRDCEILRCSPGEASVTRRIRQHRLDVGVHRLGFIIRPNLIDAFRIGIVNDHWGILPFVRGRSTPEYSFLFGMPLVVTMHFVDAGVDTGPIIKYCPVSIRKGETIRALKRRLSRTKQQRFVDVVRVLAGQAASARSVSTIPNRSEDGLQYFSMHPLLVRHVEREILAQQPPSR